MNVFRYPLKYWVYLTSYITFFVVLTCLFLFSLGELFNLVDNECKKIDALQNVLYEITELSTVEMNFFNSR